MLIFSLSKEDLEIAKAEVEALTGKKGELVEDFLFIEAESRDYSRIAYSKAVYELILEGTIDKIKKDLKNVDFEKIVVHNFKVEDHTGKLLETIADCINKPVKMKRPETLIEIFKIKNKIYVTKLLQKISHDFEKRRPHNRPIAYPFSLKPKIARAMVNLTGMKKGEAILDPFCGTGGLLIEAALIGSRVEGIDIDHRMVEACKKNLESFAVKKYNIYEDDALNWKGQMTYVVTDLPYSLNTKKQELEPLYEKFLKVLEKNLKYRAVIGSPDFIDMKKLIKKANLKLVGEHSFFLHSSLTKKIFIVEPNA